MPDPTTDHAAHLPECPRCGDCVDRPDFQGWDDDERLYCSQACADAAEEDRLIEEHYREGLREARRILAMR